MAPRFALRPVIGLRSSVLDRTGRIAMSGKFEITKDKAGKFRFGLKAGNGEIIAVSEAYE